MNEEPPKYLTQKDLRVGDIPEEEFREALQKTYQYGGPGWLASFISKKGQTAAYLKKELFRLALKKEPEPCVVFREAWGVPKEMIDAVLAKWGLEAEEEKRTRGIHAQVFYRIRGL